ncbi:hypothetical protein FA95DRAFT_1043927 [Auriscalpium vulgare]|uniref:Uncharacterized protein n=1 Tax=Auriscalpium vulgare TaxID=40419 RepID=A0ACB8R5B6_9AGAM|nr:hypothetical protein FA95DRAFT_1043927 [Auriscalpium vulgare]
MSHDASRQVPNEQRRLQLKSQPFPRASSRTLLPCLNSSRISSSSPPTICCPRPDVVPIETISPLYRARKRSLQACTRACSKATVRFASPLARSPRKPTAPRTGFSRGRVSIPKRTRPGPPPRTVSLTRTPIASPVAWIHRSRLTHRTF